LFLEFSAELGFFDYIPAPDQSTLDDVRKREAIHRVKEQMFDRVVELSVDCLTERQGIILNQYFFAGLGMHQIAANLDVFYFSVHSSLFGQRDNSHKSVNGSRGNMIGGSMRRLKKVCEADEEFSQLLHHFRMMVYRDADNLVEFYYEQGEYCDQD
jgi:hypothetical protein